MARSRRKNPILGVTTAKSDKPYKESEHRRERRMVKARIKIGDEPPATKTFGDPWRGEKDGKLWVNDPSPEILRK